MTTETRKFSAEFAAIWNHAESLTDAPACAEVACVASDGTRPTIYGIGADDLDAEDDALSYAEEHEIFLGSVTFIDIYAAEESDMPCSTELTLAALRNLRADSELCWEMAIDTCEDAGTENPKDGKLGRGSIQAAYEACDDLWDRVLDEVEAGQPYSARAHMTRIAELEALHGDATHAKAALIALGA